MDFPGPSDGGVGYLEGAGRSRTFVRLPTEAAPCREAFDTVWAWGLDRRASIAMIEAVLRR